MHVYFWLCAEHSIWKILKIIWDSEWCSLTSQYLLLLFELTVVNSGYKDHFVFSVTFFCFVSWFYLFIWLHWVLVVAWGIFSYGLWTLSSGMWDLVPRPWIQPDLPALGTQSLSHWTTREVPQSSLLLAFFLFQILVPLIHAILEAFLSFQTHIFPF